MRAPDRRHLLPGVAAFSAAVLVALLGLNAGADEPRQRPQERVRGPPAARRERLPRSPRASRAGPRRRGVARRPPHPGRALASRAHDHRPRGRHDRASPLISSHFQDEPAIEATNMMGFDVGAVGNHEFDEGGAGADARPPRRSRYQWLAANTSNPRQRRDIPPALQGDRARRGEGGLHRGHHGRHAHLAVARVQARLPLPRHLRRRQPLGPETARAGRGGDRGAGPLRRLPDR